jgi:formate hydrogenlyase subunit 6/NADH:ubiquinone oxidoreductase subunit I
MKTEELKKFAKACGADVIKIGSMDNWEGASKQMDPRYIFPDARSIIGLGFRIPRGYLRGIEEGTFFSIYEFMGYSGMNWRYMPHVLRRIVCFIEDHGYEAVPLPNWDAFSHNGYTDYPNEAHGGRQPFRSRPVAEGLPAPDVTISFRIAAVVSNLGEIGWSKMILTPEFGPMVRAVFIITEAELDCDPPIPPGTLCDQCKLCAKMCTGKAIPMKDSVKVKIGNMEIEHCNLDIARCSNAYSGGVKKFNPFWDPKIELDENSYMDKYQAPEYYGAPKGNGGPCPHIMHTRNNPAIEGARGCVRACYVHLEKQGKLTHKFHKPFRRRKQWELD